MLQSQAIRNLKKYASLSDKEAQDAINKIINKFGQSYFSYKIRNKGDLFVSLQLVEICCVELMNNIRNETVIYEDYANQLCIRGKPCIIGDGYGYTDDMTGVSPIEYCPFCGRRITKQFVKVVSKIEFY